MHADFPDAAHACAVFAGYIQRDFPDAVLEVTFHVRGQAHAQHHLNHSHELGPLLERCTQHFRGMRVYYTPHHPYGLICVMECFCPDEFETGASSPCTCNARHNRSSIAVIIHSHKDKLQLMGNRQPPTPPRHPWRAEEIH